MSRRAVGRRAQRSAGREAAGRPMEFVVAWCETAGQLDGVRKGTRRALVAEMGTRRAGPVTWRWWGGEHATVVLDELLAREPEGPRRTGWQEIRDRHVGLEDGDQGFVVMASAPAKP